MEKIFFTPGPAQLYPTVEKHILTGLQNNIGSISHRGKQFQQVFADTTEKLRQLLSLPSNFSIYFTGSATEIWEKSLTSCVEKSSFHFVNGSFSKKYFDFSKELGLSAYKIEVAMGEGFDVSRVEIPMEVDTICVTQNETSTGVQMSVSDIHWLKNKYPNKLLFVDAVSSMPHPQFDWSKVDSVFFSVQKAFGMPAGLGVWIVNQSTIEVAKGLKAKGHVATPYHNLLSLVENGSKNETPATPNVLYIYLLGRIAEDMLLKGVENIRKETSIKAKLIYDFCEQYPLLDPFVKNAAHRSETVIVANTINSATEIIEPLKKDNLIIGSGYGSLKEKQVRIANFPAISIEQVELLLDKLGRLQ